LYALNEEIKKININILSSVQNHYEKFEVKIFIKEKEEIKKIMMITMKNIVR